MTCSFFHENYETLIFIIKVFKDTINGGYWKMRKGTIGFNDNVYMEELF